MIFKNENNGPLKERILKHKKKLNQGYKDQVLQRLKKKKATKWQNDNIEETIIGRKQMFHFQKVEHLPSQNITEVQVLHISAKIQTSKKNSIKIQVSWGTKIPILGNCLNS